jgi:hypothetical protein
MRIAWLDRIGGWNTRLILAASGAVLAAGCAASSGIQVKVSEDGTTTKTLPNNEIRLEGAMKYYGADERSRVIEKQCFLDYRSREAPSGEISYEIVLTYTGVDELGIEPGRSLEFIVGMNSYVLSAEGFGKKHRDPTGKSYVETLVYPISGERLLRMSEAESIQMIVNGSSGQVKGTFDGDNFANLRRFVAECVRSAGAGAPPK